ncbi:MAG: hypothetical protein GEV09_04675 [Pseudonocardiaceae bacterium]|nr:hypothetical protein [Pseudonocardiaceae bacterium]
MSWAPARPEWVTPPQNEVADLMWVAYRLHAERGRPWSSGVLAATAWVRGGRAAPVTERDEWPVTRELAIAEMWAAVVASERDSGIPRPPVEQTCVDLGVGWREPPPVDAEYAIGAWRVLRWVLGVSGQQVPIPVPVRNPDGTILTADQLYEQVVAAEPDRYRVPERQVELRRWAAAQAQRYRQMEQLVTSTQRQVAADLSAHGQPSTERCNTG